MDVLIESSRLDDLYLEIHVEYDQKKHQSRASDQLYSAKLLKLKNSLDRLELWDDPIGKPVLTLKQSKKIDKWVRISQLSDNPTLICNKISYKRIQQGCVGNCSLLSSLISMANYDSLYNNEIVSNIFTFNRCNNNSSAIIGFARQPIQSTKFSCRVYINGTARIVRVDDWVPIRSDGRLLCAHSTEKNELWITILEKVFIKLMGNTYNLFGTNPCVDLYRFTNFIPEIIKIDNTIDYEIWDDLFNRFKSGICMSCLGTLDFENTQVNDDHELVNQVNGISESGIVSNHAYSIIDLQEIDGYKLLYIMNPWGKISWKNRFSNCDKDPTTLEIFKRLEHIPKLEDDGTFWIEWSDMIKWFSYLYISHNPKQFKYERTIHLRWKSFPHFNESLLNDFYHMGFNPQIKVSFVDKIDKMWILLIQHRKSFKKELKYIATHLYQRDNKITIFSNPDIQGTFYNSECSLSKFDNLTQQFHLITTLLNGRLKEPFNITFRIFSNENFNVDAVEPQIDECAKYLSIKSKWDVNCGGVNDFDNYFNNPHIKFTLFQYSKVLLILESQEAFHINLRVFKGIDSLNILLKQGKALTSGLCRLHICSIEDEFPEGVFTIIPSTYSGGVGCFRLIAYVTPIDCDKINDHIGKLEMMKLNESM